MKRRVRWTVGTAALLVLAGILYWPISKREITAPPIVTAQESQDGKLYGQKSPLQIDSVSAEQAPSRGEPRSNELLTPTPLRPPETHPGIMAKLASPDLTRYFTLMNVGIAQESANSDALALLRDHFSLTNEELSKLVDSSVELLAADRAYQSKQKESFCSSAAGFRNVQELGSELNRMNLSLENHQEQLGKTVESRLGTELFYKIDYQLSRMPPKEITTFDFPVLLIHQGRELETELKRICSESTTHP